ncbi:MAG: deoxyribose-phosphate aldolase [Eubacteriales bacterium]
MHTFIGKSEDELKKSLPGTIDHAVLKADATADDVIHACTLAKEYGFASVCVNAAYVPLAFEHLKGTNVKVATVVGFPLGATTSKTKAFEAKEAIDSGAGEVDMVINIGFIKSGDLNSAREDIKEVKKVCRGKALLKVILENCLLTDEEKIKAIIISKEAGADYVKTSTGMSKGGATIEDVELMYKTAGDTMKIKASGGIRTANDAIAFLKAGASRIGTGSGDVLVKQVIED